EAGSRKARTARESVKPGLSYGRWVVPPSRRRAADSQRETSAFSDEVCGGERWSACNRRASQKKGHEYSSIRLQRPPVCRGTAPVDFHQSAVLAPTVWSKPMILSRKVPLLWFAATGCRPAS